MSKDPMKKLVVKSLPGWPEHSRPRRRGFRGRHLFLLLVAVGIAFGAYRQYYKPAGVAPGKAGVSTAETVTMFEPSREEVLPPAHNREPAGKYEIRHQVVQTGDSISRILEGFGISNEHIVQWETACKTSPFAQVREGDELIVLLNREDRQPVRIIYSPPGGAPFTMRKSAEGWECRPQEAAQKTPVRTVRCRFAENFYDSCIAGGLPANLISNLADIFSYDIDFTTDFKDGDTFGVYFQEQEIQSTEGKQYLILAAEMAVSGKVYQAFGFQSSEGSWEYFDSRGASLKKTFLKSPLSYRRLISPSAYKNVKPVLKIYRPHLGIDYAAPKGTPVSSIGDGVISALNKKGKTPLSIEIRHRGGYKSHYGHLSGYSRGLYRGSIVSEGEVIGTVGAGAGGKTFLDFSLNKSGKPVNFQTADFPRLMTVPKSARTEFEKTRDAYVAALGAATPKSQEPPSGKE
ncbi:MAG: M23 family metallopeptidase [Syntrophobacter sp.]